MVTGFLDLVAPAVPYPDDAALYATPHLQGALLHSRWRAGGAARLFSHPYAWSANAGVSMRPCGSTSSIRRKDASAWPTTWSMFR